MESSMKFFIIAAISFSLYTMPHCSPVDNHCSSAWAVYCVDANRLLQNDVLSPSDNLDLLNSSSATVRLTLLHREHPCLLASTRPVNYSSSTLSRYYVRLRRLAGRFSSCLADEVNVSNQHIGDGVHWDYYTYITQIQVGTPVRIHSVLVDTGSSLSWIGCQPCSNGCLYPTFNPAAYSTYNIVRCQSSICNAIPAATMSPGTCVASYQACSFEQTYEDNSTSVGVVSSDRLVYGRAAMQGFIFGCSNSFEGVGGQYSGIIGLSANKLSFFSQISLGRYKARSYCFPHPNKVSFSQFGQYNEKQDGMSYTPLFFDNKEYYVHITDITVGGSSLNIRSGQNGTLRCSIDSGTAYTVVPPYLFASLSNAVENNIKGYNRVGVSTGQTCFYPDMWWDSENEDTQTVEIVFKDGPKLTLVENLFFQAEQYLCLAFKRSERNVDEVVLGSRHIMTFYTIVDLEKSRMGISNHGCAN